MARPREFDEEAAMKAVEDVFWLKGFEGTSYADLMAATGLGKGSLYAAYGNKEALYRHALSLYIDREVEQGCKLMESTETASGKDLVAAFLDQVIDAVTIHNDRRGCFLCNAAVDLAPLDEAVEKIVLAAMDRMRTALIRILAFIPDQARRSAAAEHVLSIYVGMRVMVKAGTPVDRLRLARDAVLRSL